MWPRFIDFLETLIREFGLIKILGAIGAALSVLAATGLIFSHSGLAEISLTTLIVVLLVTCVSLFLDRRMLYQERQASRILLKRYALELKSRQSPRSYRIKTWREEATFFRRGRVQIRRRLTLEVGDEPLTTFHHRLWPDDPPGDRSVRRNIKPQAHFTDASGETVVSIPLFTQWEHDKLLILFILTNPVPPGALLNFSLIIDWPFYSEGLIEKGLPARQEWVLRHPAESISYGARFPRDVKRSRRLVAVAFPGSPPPSVINDSSESKITFEAADIDAGSRIGFELELRAD